MQISQKVSDHPLHFTLILSLFLSLLLYNRFIFGTELFIFTDVGSDTNNGYIPLIFLKSHLKEHFSLFSFHWGLGESILKNVFVLDIFTMPAIFMNEIQILKSMVYIMLIKHLSITFIFFNFLKYYCVSNFAKMIASLFMTYSAFVIIWGQHYMLSSLIVFFLLTLWAFEIWLHEKKYIFFIFSLSYFSICCGPFSVVYLVHFFIFLFFYGLLRYMWINNLNSIFPFIIKTILIVIVSLLISSFYLLPVTNMLVESPRVSANLFNFNLIKEVLPFGVQHVLITILRFMSNDLLGVGTQFNKYIPFSNFYEVGNLYSGLLPLLLFPFIVEKTTKFQKIYLTVSLILSYLFLNNKFFVLLMSGYSKVYEFRYGYIFSILLSISVATAITNIQKYGIKKDKLFFSYVLIILLSGISLYFAFKLNLNWQIPQILIIKFFIIIFFFLGAYLYFFNKPLDITRKAMIICIVILEIFIQSYASINQRSTVSKNVIQNKEGYFDSSSDVIKFLKIIDSEAFYRVYKTYNSVFLNDAIMQDFFGINAYNSLNAHTALMFKFNNVLQSPGFNYIWSSKDLMYLNSLLSVKYVLSKEKMNENNFFKYIKTIDNINIYENKMFVPLGTVFTKYISEKDAPSYPFELEKLMYTHLILKDDKFSINNEQTLTPTEEYLESMKINVFQNDYIHGTIEVKNDALMLFQIPYDKGWKIYLDGKSVEIQSVDFGMIAIRVLKGKHEIELKYFPYLMKEGFYFSLLGLILLLVFHKFQIRRSRFAIKTTRI